VRQQFAGEVGKFTFSGMGFLSDVVLQKVIKIGCFFTELFNQSISRFISQTANS